ncbi:MAG: hypothetical protein V7785_11250 [Bermanella sp.]
MALRTVLLGLALVAWCEFAASDFTIDEGESFSISDNEVISVSSNLTIDAGGTFNGANASITRVSGDWVNNGFYNANSNVAYFTGLGTTTTIVGDNTFYDFIIDHDEGDTANKRLNFEPGSIQSITNSLTINGRTASSLIPIGSTTPGQQYNAFEIGRAKSVVVDFVDVQDAIALNGNVDALNSINSGNTLDWFGAGSLFVDQFWPVTDAIGVSFSDNCLSVLFTNPVNPVPGKNLTIRDSTGVAVVTIPVNDESRVTFDGSMVVLETGVALSPQERYTAQLDSGAFELANSVTSIAPVSTTVFWQFTTLVPDSTAPKTLDYDNGIVAIDAFTAGFLDPDGDGDQSDSLIAGLIASQDSNDEEIGFSEISGQVDGARVTHSLDIRRDDIRQETYIDTSIPADGKPEIMWDVDANTLEKVNLEIVQVISDGTNASADVTQKTGFPRGDDNAQLVDSAIPHLSGNTVDANHTFRLWGFNGGELKAVTQPITTGVTGWEVTDADYILPLDIGDNMVVLRGSTSLPLPIVTPASIRLTKLANRKEISVGGIVTYTITAENLTTATLAAVNVIDDIPPGFKYYKGSAHLDGVAVPPSGIGEGILTFDMQSIDPGTSNIKILRYQLVVGTGVNLGKYGNTAVAAAPGGNMNAALSAPAKASVNVVPDALFDLSTILGKVFHDRNGDGFQQPGEEPIPHAKVVSASGKIITTDRNGQYHIGGVKEGRHAIRIDERSLPYGTLLTTRKVNVANVSRGIPAKANFGVQLPNGQNAQAQILRIEPISNLKPLLNVALANNARLNQKQTSLVNPIEFYLFSNYGAFFENWKLEIFEPLTKRTIKTLSGNRNDFFKPVIWNGETNGNYPVTPNTTLAYRLIVTDGQGRIDMTKMKLFSVNTWRVDNNEEFTRPNNIWLNNQGRQDSTEQRQISIDGKGVQLFGDGYNRIRIKQNQKLILEMPIFDDGKVSATNLLADGSVMDETEMSVAELILPKEVIYIEALSSVKGISSHSAKGAKTLGVKAQEIKNKGATDSRATVQLNQSNINTLESIPDHYYTVQLLTGRRLLNVQMFLHDKGASDGAIVKVVSKGEYWYAGLLGYYPDATSAQLAAKIFGQKYPAINPWIRSIFSLKNVAVEQSELLPVWLKARAQKNSEPVGNRKVISQKGKELAENKSGINVQDEPVFIVDNQGINLGREHETDLFFVALIDAEVGYRDINGNMETATAGDSRFKEKVWKDGKIALYLKGTIKGKYLITANYDSERESEELFRELDADEIYPIYGDQSLTQDVAADAFGKLYLLVEWDNSSAKWGKYSTAINKTDLAHFERSLQGGKLNFQSVETTPHGEPVTTAIAFDARALQKSVQNEFLATGGSLYYLKHQGVIDDSLQVRVEVRDLITGNVLDAKTLVAVVDYELDASAGRLTFAHPVDRYVDSGLLTTTNLDNGNLIYVVTNYNYAIIDDYDKGISGGRVKQALTDNVSLGATYANEDKDSGEYTLSAGDLTVHLSDNAQVTLEYAQTQSLGIDRHVSTDGGLNWAIDDAPSLAEQILAEDQVGRAWGAKGDASFIDERINLYYYYREVGDKFSANATSYQLGKKGAGFDMNAGLTANTGLRYKRDSQWQMDAGSLETGVQLQGNKESHSDIVQVTHNLERLSLTGEYRSQRFTPLSSPLTSNFMKDTEIYAVEANYELNDTTQLLAAQQLTGKGEGNNQTSLGLRQQYTDNLNVGALGIFGDKGEALEADASYQLAKKLSTSATLRQGSLGDKSILGASYTPDEFSSYRLSLEKIGKQKNGLNGEADTARNDVVIGTTHKFGDGYTLDQNSSVTVAGEKERIANGAKLGKEMEGGRSIYGSVNVHEEQNGGVSSNGEGVEVGGSLNFNWAGYVKGGRGFVNRLDGERDRRTVGGFGIAYVRLDPDSDRSVMKARFSAEQQSDRGTGDRDSQLIKFNARGRLTKDWSLMTEIDWGRTTDNATDKVTARRNRYDLGFAYRPVLTDALNLLGKYSWVDNEAPDNQSSITGLEADKGQVYAADILYDLNRYWQVGSKLAYRMGEEKIVDLPWAKTNTWLTAIRGGYLFTADTKLTIEFRRLDQQQAQDSKDGYVFEFSRRFNDSIEAAIGYNYAGFNDDLGDMDYTVKGTYIRITGTFTE